jgi:DTW domain-containing protein YfiP
MRLPLPPSRAICLNCQRPARACLCHCVQAVHSQVQVLVLQHPLEVGHAKNSARLLHLCLPGSRLTVGERFAEQDLQAWLKAPWGGRPQAEQALPVLLYPETPADPQLPVVTPAPLPEAWLARPERLRLVVIDGTWRKSRKMLYLNPALQALPRLSLRDVPCARYRIRKAQAPGQLSTFEAAALALAQLQRWDAQHQAWQQLMASFDAFLDHHEALPALGATSRQVGR